MKNLAAFLLLLEISTSAQFYVEAFQIAPLHSHKNSVSSTKLFDLSEWRDIMFDSPELIGGSGKTDDEEGPLREICILPFPLDDALIQGETKELCLYEER
jgi:hypothetical protein